MRGLLPLENANKIINIERTSVFKKKRSATPVERPAWSNPHGATPVERPAWGADARERFLPAAFSPSGLELVAVRVLALLPAPAIIAG